MPASWRPLAVLPLLLALALAGCTGPPAQAPAPSSTSLTRIVDIMVPEGTLNEFESPDQQLARVAQVTFEFKPEETVEVEGVTARYRTIDGREATVDLSSLTAETQIQAGQVVTLRPPRASVVSALTLERDGVAFAQRRGIDRAWLTAGSNAIPVASTLPGLGTWKLHAESAFDVHGHGLEFTTEMGEACDENGCVSKLDATRIAAADIAFNQTIDGTVQLGTTVTSRSTKLNFTAASLTSTMNIDMGLQGQVGNLSMDLGVAGTSTTTTEGSIDITFDARGDAVRTGRQGRTTTQGEFQTRGLPPALEAAFPPTMESEEVTPYRAEAIDFPVTNDPTLHAFLRHLWSMDLAEGDSYTFRHVNETMSLTYVSKVLARETRTSADGVAHDTFKVHDQLRFTLNSTTRPHNFDSDMDTWVDAATYMPVYQEGEFLETIRAINYPEIRDAVERELDDGEGGLVRWAEDAVFAVRTEVFVEMLSFEGNATQAPILAVGAARLAPLSIPFIANLAKGTLAPAKPPRPAVTFEADDAIDRITVFSAEPGANWRDIAVTATSCEAPADVTVDIGRATPPHQNREANDLTTHAAVSAPGCNGLAPPVQVSTTATPVFARDWLAFCSAGGLAKNVTMEIVEPATNTLLGMFEFEDIAVCA